MLLCQIGKGKVISFKITEIKILTDKWNTSVLSQLEK